MSRRLFPHGLVDGTRTPPPCPSAALGVIGPKSSSVAVASSGPATAPVISAITAIPSVGIQPISSRQTVGMPRPSPRTAVSAPGLQSATAQHRSTSSTGTGPPPSPHHPHRPFIPQPRDASQDGAAQVGSRDIPQVRTLVSEFERRSNSQGAPPRVTDPSPSRQFIYSAAPTGPRPTGSSSSRAASREIPVARVNSARMASMEAMHVDGDLSLGHVAVGGEETAAMALNLGMSPMLRQVNSYMPARMAGPPSSSPSAKAPVSVQERIRQFNPAGNRFGR